MKYVTRKDRHDIEDHIDEEWDVEDDDDDIESNVPKPPFVQEEKGFI